MRKVDLHLEPTLYGRVRAHLLRERSQIEQAAFLLCETTASTTAASFACLDAVFIKHQQFAIHSEFHLELDDATCAQVIKTAHDRRCSLVEIHAHPLGEVAQFSASDFDGLDEFVPHVWWRLRHRPYGALVITPTSIDGLAWIDGPGRVEPIDVLRVGDQAHHTSGASYRTLTEVVNEPLRSK